MKTIKLMADYYCFPLWEASPDQVGNIDPHTLPITNKLVDELISWAHKYDATLDLDNPTNSGFKSNEDEAAFNKIGMELTKKLQEELGENFKVIFEI